MPSSPASNFFVLFRSRAVRTAVLALSVPLARGTERDDVPGSPGMLRFAPYCPIFSLQNMSRRCIASCSPAGHSDAYFFAASRPNFLLLGASGTGQSKSALNDCLALAGFFFGGSASSNNSGLPWMWPTHERYQGVYTAY